MYVSACKIRLQRERVFTLMCGIAALGQQHTCAICLGFRGVFCVTKLLIGLYVDTSVSAPDM